MFRHCRWLPLLLGMVLAGGIARAQNPPIAQENYVPLSMADLQQLVAPIALYPDALLAQVLVASTYPDDVLAAARWEDAGNNPQDTQALNAQPWDSSVQGVARYPSVLHYLAGNPDWMNDLGAAFLNQKDDLMAAVQNLRAQAIAAGTLVSTPQQTVINQGGYIQIIPTNPDVIYVPVYNPQVVYVVPAYPVVGVYRPRVTFGVGVRVGDWLDFDLDWMDHDVYFGHWGANRPWWHHDHGRVFRYADDRPGIYRPGEFKDRAGHPIDVPSSRWVRDARKPRPLPLHQPAARPLDTRPERGYPPKAAAPVNPRVQPPRPTGTIPTYGPGSEVTRESARGKASRSRVIEPAPRAAPRPAPKAAPRAEPAPAPTPAPRAVQPAPERLSAPKAAPAPRPEPVRAPPVRSAPPPEARPSAPVQGGAMGGYQSGQEASREAARGAQSRGRR